MITAKGLMNIDDLKEIEAYTPYWENTEGYYRYEHAQLANAIFDTATSAGWALGDGQFTTDGDSYRLAAYWPVNDTWGLAYVAGNGRIRRPRLYLTASKNGVMGYATAVYLKKPHPSDLEPVLTKALDTLRGKRKQARALITEMRRLKCTSEQAAFLLMRGQLKYGAWHTLAGTASTLVEKRHLGVWELALMQGAVAKRLPKFNQHSAVATFSGLLKNWVKRNR